MRILRGIPPELVAETAALLVDAFDQKVQHELRPRTPEQARRLAARSLTPDLGWVALAEDGIVLGVIGIGMRGRRFSHMSYCMLAEEFGPLGAVWRWMFAFFEQVFVRPRKLQWRIEVLAVAESARGKGVGTDLVRAVIDAAREAGMRSVRLEVVDVNDDALRLYERLGFRSRASVPTGWLTAGGGYRAVCFMTLDL